MNGTVTSISRVDPRAGSAWLTRLKDPERLQLLAALLGRFNHDLRTPLNTIAGWTYLLQSPHEATRNAHIADVIARNTRDQTKMLEEFVDDGRAILGVLKLPEDEAQVDEALNAASDRLSPLLTLHNVTMAPAKSVGDARVAADSAHLLRLIYRVLAAVVRRATDGAVMDLEVGRESSRGWLCAAAPAATPDWSDAALLDLKIATLHAALMRASVEVDADSARSTVRLVLTLA